MPQAQQQWLQPGFDLTRFDMAVHMCALLFPPESISHGPLIAKLPTLPDLHI